MKKERPNPGATLATNLNFLMAKFRYSEKDLERLCGVSSKTINNMRNGRHRSQLDNVDAVAAVFGLNLWHLIMPSMIDSYESLADLTKLEAAYSHISPTARAYLLQVAERETAYAVSPKAENPAK